MIEHKMLSQISKTMGWPFTLVYLSLIISALYFTFVVAPNAINVNDWPYVQGKVTQLDLIERKRSNKNSDIISVHSAKIKYQYIVDDKNYVSTQLKLAERNKEKILSLIEKEYASGSKVTVYYNPENPSQSTLQQGLSSGHILTGLFLLVSICAMALALYRNARKRRLK